MAAERYGFSFDDMVVYFKIRVQKCKPTFLKTNLMFRAQLGRGRCRKFHQNSDRLGNLL